MFMEATGGEHNLLLPETYDIVWGTIVFLVIAVVFTRLVLPKFNKVMDERTDRIKQGLENAEDAEKKLTAAQTEAVAIISQARSEAASIRDDAREQAQRIIEKAKQDASAEAQRINAAALAQIEAEKASAKRALQSDIGSIATSLAEKIVGENLKNEELNSRVIDRFLDDLSAEMAS